MSGRLIVIEGVDGAGTTTLAARLTERCRARRMAVFQTNEPSSGPVGALVRQALSHRFVVHTELGSAAPGWKTMALLFAADRLDHLESEIMPALRDGVTVISDRYDLSSLAYQSAVAGLDDPAGAASSVAWIRTLNAHARRPDLTLVLDVPAEVASRRRRERARAAELYEDEALQVRLVEAYARAEHLVVGDHVVHLDATRSIDEVLAAAEAALDACPQFGRSEPAGA